ncbi:MAG: hypothetical protein HPY60_10065 [Candidatus Methanofastidiosum sp.]|nr:hypothetical protein [Methanofastidiosum sp.]NYT14180.1 hypothetical protein [Candidatus Methanofastidiosa archaeon]
MDVLKNIVTSLEDLISAIEQNGPYKERQIEFTKSIEEAWKVYSQGKIDTKIAALPKVMYIYATEELPKEIEKGDLSKVIRDLKQFKNTMKYVIEPSYKQ